VPLADGPGSMRSRMAKSCLRSAPAGRWTVACPHDMNSSAKSNHSWSGAGLRTPRLSTEVGAANWMSEPIRFSSGDCTTTNQPRLNPGTEAEPGATSADRLSVLGVAIPARQFPQLDPHAASIGCPQLGQGRSTALAEAAGRSRSKLVAPGAPTGPGADRDGRTDPASERPGGSAWVAGGTAGRRQPAIVSACRTRAVSDDRFAARSGQTAIPPHTPCPRFLLLLFCCSPAGRGRPWHRHHGGGPAGRFGTHGGAVER